MYKRQVKDFIAPSSFRFGDGRMFQMGGKFGAVSFLQIAAPELSDRMLADFMEAENGIVVNLHIQSCLLYTSRKREMASQEPEGL